MRLLLAAALLLCSATFDCQALVQHANSVCKSRSQFANYGYSLSMKSEASDDDIASSSPLESSTTTSFVQSRRSALITSAAATLLAALPLLSSQPSFAADSTTDTSENSMFAPTFVQQYDDFIATPSGMSYRNVVVASNTDTAASAAQLGDRLVFDWSGYTIGYFGRPFQAKGGPQGGAFDKDLDYERTVLGSGKIVRGLEQALIGMRAGDVRQVIVPFGDLSYPQTKDPSHEAVGPKPSTFSGQRALNFVLDNPRLDRTLLFNVKVIRVDKPNASGGFTRG